MLEIERINNIINSFVWGPYMLVLLVGTGVYMTIRTRLFQITKINLWMKSTYGSLHAKDKNIDHNVTPFQAVSTALASTIGIGSIAGIATAIVAGGPGALFWMLVSAFFGMITKFSEVVLAVYFREKDHKGVHYGGPMYYIEKGIKQKWLAMIFAVFASIATFGAGNMTQSNSIASLLNETFKIPNIASGIAVAIIVAIVIIGGIKRVSSISEKIVPFMALFYFITSVIVLIINSKNIPNAVNLIISNAFSLKSVGAGISGYVIVLAMRYGIARGVFSNEAGIGTAPIVHAASNTNNPIEQGMWGIFEVFNTLIICILTGLIILSSNIYGHTDADGAVLTSLAFKSALGYKGEVILTLASVLFAFSTIIGWSYYGESCLGYLTKRSKFVIMAYKLIFIAAIVVGAAIDLKIVWSIADTFNGLMAIPNLIAILLLSPIVITLTKKYIKDPSSVEID
ncbi:sodium:alanine symporter family protein [uncultured Brachyspira sp.]|uniref:alanine/glycine:cation symporter family protein n=1 Tax=uncultured Brachyspira sp. TaxID=221953 RepID=UPI002634F4A3|nr:sodium:alanine symporter family protein [uncultured Brachyspira sp.]